MADFDLSAFYATIDHELLLDNLFPRGGSPRTLGLSNECLEMWSSKTYRHNHGIPQGPHASGVLAESVMLSIDEVMSSKYKYARYVDDIKILASSQMEVQRAVAELDILCKEKGLIPNKGKLGIKKVESEDELTSHMPDLLGYHEGGRSKSLSQGDAEELLVESLSNAGTEIVDKSKFRYTLFRAPRSRKILYTIARLWKSFPEHTDAYVSYLETYPDSQLIKNLAIEILTENYPYAFVQGECWKFVAKMATVNEKTVIGTP
ncbi:MAG: RNA-directed DNA polymerase [Chloroflexi bacterium]|nr:RNA-directed DNA polymerase [Chloroflexota bacterium]